MTQVAVVGVTGEQDDLLARVTVLARELAEVAVTDDPFLTDQLRVTRIQALETLKCAATAAQARVTAEFAASQRGQQVQGGVPASRAGRGIPSQVGLARRESPNKGQRLTGLATCLVDEMPHTLAALARGELNEWRATIIVRETATLSREHRAAVDRELCGPGGDLAGMGDRAIERAARAIGQRLDPKAAWARQQKAVRERRVTIRPEPDCMVRLTAYLPVMQGVAVFAALSKAADTAIATGRNFSGREEDGETPLTRGQVMTDELIARVLGAMQTAADAAGDNSAARRVVPEPPVELQLIMSDRTLFGEDDEPAHLNGYGPIPAPVARRIVLGSTTGTTAGSTTGLGGRAGPDSEARDQAVRWVRRLYRRSGADGGSGRGLIAMDSHRRLFPEGVARFVVARDQFCRTPWCDAPIRHIDHVDTAADGGATSAVNAQGLCEACNYAKQAPGWRQDVQTGNGDIVTTTPAGHRYTSRPPRLPGERSSKLEGFALRHLAA